MIQWFQQQSRRDQIALLIGGFFLAAYLLWLAVLRPLADSAEQARTREESTAASLARVRSLAATVQELQSSEQDRPPSQGLNIANLVDRSTNAAGLRAASMDPSGDGESASVRFDNAALPDVLEWLHELENRYQVEVEHMSLIAANEPGEVAATVRLRKSG